MLSNVRKKIKPDSAHTINLRLLIFPAATSAPKKDDASNVTMIPYPICVSFIYSEPTSFAISPTANTVIPILINAPNTNPAGIDTALPVGL